MDMQSLDIFEGIDAGVVEEIRNAGATMTFDAGTTIFENGAPASNLYILEQGDIDLVSQTDDTSLNLNRPGDVFGWSCLVDKGVYTTTARVQSQAKVQCIARADIDPIFDRNAKDALVLYKNLGNVFSKRMGSVVS